MSYGGTCFRMSNALIVRDSDEWDVQKHVSPL